MRRILGGWLVLAVSVLVAAGCSSETAAVSGDGVSGVVGSDGPLAWMPPTTWAVFSADTDPKKLDRALTTFKRLPIWAVVESSLPASTGAGLRKEALREIANAATRRSSSAKVTTGDLERAFGTRLGAAMVSNDRAQFSRSDRDPDVAMWVEIDDESAATDVLRKLATKKPVEHEYDGVTYYVAATVGRDGAYLIQDKLLVSATSEAVLKRLIRAHDGDHNLAHNDTARAMIDSSIGDTLVGAAVATDPVLQLARDAAEHESSTARDKRLAGVLTAGSVDDLVPDWLGGSVNVDDSGVRTRAVWSNPRDLAAPDTNAREAVELMPAAAPIAQASSQDGSALGRLQRVWRDVRDAGNFDLEHLSDTSCTVDKHMTKDQVPLCRLGYALARWMLDDETLANKLDDAPDATTVFTQDMGPTMASLALATRTNRPHGAVVKRPARRFMEIGVTPKPTPRDTPLPPAYLVKAAADAGISVAPSRDLLTMTIRVQPNSPAGRELVRALATWPKQDAQTFTTMFGIDPKALLSAKGFTMSLDTAGEFAVGGFPPSAPGSMAASISGDDNVERVGDSETYKAAVDAAKVPDSVGFFEYVNVQRWADSMLQAVATEQPDANRVGPIVRNNLDKVPGVVSWTTRERENGRELGVAETVIVMTK